MKLLNLIIREACEECPYFNCKEGGYYCTNSPYWKKFEYNRKERKWEGEFEIPDWCPLPDFK